jgi:hypothetical protein
MVLFSGSPGQDGGVNGGDLDTTFEDHRYAYVNPTNTSLTYDNSSHGFKLRKILKADSDTWKNIHYKLVNSTDVTVDGNTISTEDDNDSIGFVVTAEIFSSVNSARPDKGPTFDQNPITKINYIPGIPYSKYMATTVNKDTSHKFIGSGFLYNDPEDTTDPNTVTKTQRTHYLYEFAARGGSLTNSMTRDSGDAFIPGGTGGEGPPSSGAKTYGTNGWCNPGGPGGAGSNSNPDDIPDSEIDPLSSYLTECGVNSTMKTYQTTHSDNVTVMTQTQAQVNNWVNTEEQWVNPSSTHTYTIADGEKVTVLPTSFFTAYTPTHGGAVIRVSNSN